MKRLNVLMSAYACEPGEGSEPGVGWHTAREVARHHDVWVLTRANNRAVIEAELARNPVPSLHFVYYDLPAWARAWKRGGRGIQLYYYLWQLGVYPVMRRLARQLSFDAAHHVTFVKYWAPSSLAFLDLPLLWGPVGGGESTPAAFVSDYSARGQRQETLRTWARTLAEYDPLVRLSARRSKLSLAATAATAQRIKRLSATPVRVVSQVGAPRAGLERALSTVDTKAQRPWRIVSVGNLLHWKGFHLALRAFAAAELKVPYDILGSGPERGNLEALARELGVDAYVTFHGKVSLDRVGTMLSEAHILLYPSLHDSGSFVCLEALSAATPVVCLDLGGPGVLVADEVGVKVPAHTPQQAVSELASALKLLTGDRELWRRKALAAPRHVLEHHTWEAKGETFAALYRKLLSEPG